MNAIINFLKWLLNLLESAPPITPTPPQPTPVPAPTPQPTPVPVPPAPHLTNPFLQVGMYVDLGSLAYQWLKNSDPNHTTDVALMHKIADQPQGFWIMPEFDPKLANILSEAANKIVLLNIYGMINRDNGGASSGGCANPDAYKAWIDGIATIITQYPQTRVACNIEPDAIDFTIDNTTDPNYHVRFDLLSYALQKLTLSNSAAYLAVGWHTAPQILTAIAAISFKDYRGFCLDTSGFDFQKDMEQKATDLYNGTHKPSIIDTSRDGNGPWNVDQSQDPWCNPPDRALGIPPVAANSAVVDAYVWAKRPGESDGPNGGRGPSAGTFMPDYALMLARNAKW